MQFLEKLRSLVHFDYSSRKRLFGIIYKHLQKDSSKNEVSKYVKKEPTPSKKLIFLEKEQRVKVVLFYRLLQNTTAEQCI